MQVSGSESSPEEIRREEGPSKTRSAKVSRESIGPTFKIRISRFLSRGVRAVKSLVPGHDIQALVEEPISKDKIEVYTESLREAKQSISDSRTTNFYEKSSAEQKFKKLLRKLDPDERCKLVITLLTEYSSKEKNDDYQFIIQHLYRVFPGLNEYIVHRAGSNGVITPLGTKLLVDYLSDKKSLKLSCSVCANTEEFEEEMKSFYDNPDREKMCFILKFPEAHARHLAPLYAEKRKDGIRFVMTDSLGALDQYAMLFCQQVVNSLKKLDLQDYILYLCSAKRQQDETSCPIFSLRDVVQYSKTPQFLRFVELSAEKSDRKLTSELREKQNLSNVIVFDDLPPAMLKTAQSLAFIKKHDEKSDEGFIYKSLGKHLITIESSGNQKERNNLINERFLKYERLIFARVLAEALRPRDH